MKTQKILLSKKGFTLIELLLVITLMAAITAISVRSFLGYSQYQQFSQSVNDFVNILNTAKSNAYAQVKPTTGACVGGVLQGYRITLTGGSGKYDLYAVCSGSNVSVSTYTANPNVKFKVPESTTNNILFNVFTGGVVGSGNVVLRGWGNTYTKTVIITPIGVIKVQ